MQTRHAEVRAQQRGIPPFIDQILDLYGHEEYDGHGAVLIFFDKKSIRRMEQDMGREPVRRLSEWHNAYKVKSVEDGKTITIGRLTRRVRRR